MLQLQERPNLTVEEAREQTVNFLISKGGENGIGTTG